MSALGKKKRLLAGIDVGSTKICTAIARLEEEEIRLLGVGESPARGIKKGVIVNLSEAVESIKTSLEMAEEKSETVVGSAYVSVGGSLMRGFNRQGETEVLGRNGEIGLEDMARAVAAAQSFPLPEDYQILHVLTQSYCVDGQEGILDPKGMRGRHLSVRLHLVLNANAIVQNLVNALNKANVVVDGVVMQPLASAEAVLSQDEKELGTVVVDIGGGTTDLVIYSQGSILHSEVLPFGGNLFTKDIAIGLKIPLQEAEELKRTAGTVFPEDVPAEELLEVSEVGTGRRRTVSRKLLCEVIRARAEEILQALAEVLQKVGIRADLITGVVLTGGGALLDGLAERAEQMLLMPVRIGYPVNLANRPEELFHPAYSTALGLLQYARDIQGPGVAQGPENAPSAGRPATQRVKKWILERIT